MKKKTYQIIWLLIILLFVFLSVHNFISGNYFDLALSLFIVLIPILCIGIHYLLRKNNKNGK